MPAGRRHRAFGHASGAALFVAAISFATGRAQAGPLELLADPSLDARSLLIAGIFLGLVAFFTVAALLFLRATHRARRAEARARSNAGQYDRKMDFLKAVLAAEPQFLVHWNEAGDPAIVADTLGKEMGIPHDITGVLAFSSWLDRESALELESHVETLRSEGHGFNIMVKSATGAHFEVDGRAAGGGSVLKFRDLEGRRSELADFREQHRVLRKEIDTIRSLLDALPMPVWVHGASGKLEWVNRAYARAVDAADGAQVYDQQIEFLHSHHRDAARRHLDAGEMFRGRVETVVGGETRSYDTIILPTGQAQAGIAIGGVAGGAGETDLSRRIMGQTQILDQIATAVAVFCADQRITYFNKAFEELWEFDHDWLESGPKEGEVLDRLREQRRIPEQADYHAWKKACLNIYEDGNARQDWWHLPDGRTIHVVAERSPDGGITCLYENKTETLALKSRYNALMHVQKETLDHLGEGVAVFGSDGRLKLFNPSFAAIWNLDSAELEAEPHIDTVITTCRALLDADDIWSEMMAVVTSIDDERKQIDGQFERLDGMYVSYAALPLPDGGTLLTYVDISDTKRMENALIERNDALVAADRLKSTFISHVSYELRTPLTNIIGFSEFMLNPAIGPLTEKQREYLGDIRSSSDTLLAIIDDILDMATIDAGNLALKIIPTTAKEIIDAAILGVRERLTRANIGLAVKISTDATEFLADPRRMTQVLYNLLSNAIGFSERGTEVSLECRRDGQLIEISVEDKGCGMSEDYQQTAFDRFESKPNGSRHRGAGLGLAIVKSLVELHGGSVGLTSVPNEGTRVTIRFPADGPHVRTGPESGEAEELAPQIAVR